MAKRIIWINSFILLISASGILGIVFSSKFSHFVSFQMRLLHEKLHYYQPTESEGGEISNKQLEKLSKITLRLKPEDFERISELRNKAIKTGIISKEEKEKFKGELILGNDSEFPVKYGLKGMMIDHLNEPSKWSFRIKIKQKGQIFGCSEFVLQHPKTRNFLNDFALMETAKSMGLPTLKTKLVNFQIEVDGEIIPFGVMQFQEHLNSLIDNNIEGVQAAGGLNENDFGLILQKTFMELRDNTPYKVKMDLASNILGGNFDPSFKIRKGLTGFFDDNLKMKLCGFDCFTGNEIDVRDYARFLVVTNFFGATHTFIWHNLEFYKVDDKIHFVVWDGNAGGKINKFYMPMANAFVIKPCNTKLFIREIIDAIHEINELRLDDLLSGLSLEEEILETAFPGEGIISIENFEWNRSVLNLYAVSLNEILDNEFLMSENI